MTLCQRLVDLGVYHSDGPGRPRLYDSSEESQLRKRLVTRANQTLRRAKLREAKLRGEAQPTFPRGRRPLYTTRAEAQEAKRLQDKQASQRYKERLAQALQALVEKNRPDPF